MCFPRGPNEQLIVPSSDFLRRMESGEMPMNEVAGKSACKGYEIKKSGFEHVENQECNLKVDMGMNLSDVLI